MLSKRSYVRLFTMAVLLAGSYAGLQGADGQLICSSDDGVDHLYACYSGQVRDHPFQQQACANDCQQCGFSSTVAFYDANPGGPENGPNCNWILYCACGVYPD
jgi:hypothetical protein